jgi:hypothetical protein
MSAEICTCGQCRVFTLTAPMHSPPAPEAPPCPGIHGIATALDAHCPGCGTAPRLTAEERLLIDTVRHYQAIAVAPSRTDLRALLAILDRLAPPKGAPRG